MNHNPLLSLIAESFDHMFVIDKRGKMIFFPWGSNKPGYFIKSKSAVAKAKKFYRISFFISFVALGITISFFHDFWVILGSMVFFLGGWYLVYFLYTSNITKHLLPAKISYKDVVLEKLEPEEVEEKNSYDTQPISQLSNSRPQIKNDPLLGLKRIWYRLSPSQLFLGYFFLGILVIMIWSTIHPQKLGDSLEDYLIASLVGFLWGLSGFVMVTNMESSKPDLWGFLNWKLPMILLMLVCWVAAAWSLYKFFIMMI